MRWLSWVQADRMSKQTQVRQKGAGDLLGEAVIAIALSALGEEADAAGVAE